MIAILTALLPVFAITAIGHLLVRARAVSDEAWHGLDQLNYLLLFPALLLKTLARADLTHVPAASFVIVVVGSVTIMAGMFLAWHLTRHAVSGPQFTSLFQGGIRFQSIIVVALSAALFGQPGVTFAALALAAVIPFAQLYTTLVLIVFGHTASATTMREVAGKLVTNPFTLACAVGLLLNATGLPDFAYDTLSILGSASIGLSLLTVGAGLRFDNVRAVGALVAGNVAVRLVGMPLIVIALSSLTSLSGLGRTVALIAAGVPTAATAYTLARKLGGDAPLMAQIITAQTVGAAITLPVLIYLFR
jgi:predicted permease